MYDELTNALRRLSDWSIMDYEDNLSYANQIVEEAADAIEELSAFREHITDGHFYCMRGGVLYEAKVELPKGKVFQLPPIVFVEEE